MDLFFRGNRWILQDAMQDRLTNLVQIFPANVRAKGLGIAASGQTIGSIIVGQVWPVAVANIGARTYFIFMSFNIFALVLIYWTYPETAKKTLEEIDSQFGNANVHSATEATPKEMMATQIEQIEVSQVVTKAA